MTYATTTQLTAETTARKNADTTEKNARTAADTTLTTNLAAEGTARLAGDRALQAAIDALTARVAVLEPPVIVPAPPPVTPPPASRPWAAPTTVRTVQIPPSIDATGATDVTAALRNFLTGVSDGSIITGGGPGATYRTSGAFLPSSKNHLVLDGQGATIHNIADANAGSGWTPYAASFFWWTYGVTPYPTHITIANWVAKGASPAPGTFQSGEYAAFLHAMGGSYLEVTNVTASGLFGDLVTLNENAQNVWVHGNHMIDCGRNSVSVVCGSHVLIEDNVFSKAGYCSFDIEPEKDSIADLTDIVYRRNMHGLWVKNDFMSLDGVDSGKHVSDVTIDGNTISGSTLLSVLGGATGIARPARIRFTNNTGLAGDSVTFRHCDGVTFTGNVGPNLPPPIDCTGVVTA